MKKRIASILLALIMLFSLLPTAALAKTDDPTTRDEEDTVYFTLPDSLFSGDYAEYKEYAGTYYFPSIKAAADYITNTKKEVFGEENQYNYLPITIEMLPYNTEKKNGYPSDLYPQAWVEELDVSGQSASIALFGGVSGSMANGFGFNAFQMGSDDMEIALKLYKFVLGENYLDGDLNDFVLTDKMIAAALDPDNGCFTNNKERSRAEEILASVTPYLNWDCDFEVAIDRTLNAGDVSIAGQYDANSENWIAVGAEVTENVPIRLLEFAAGAFSYQSILMMGRFNCGVVNNWKPKAEGATMTVELRMYETDPTATGGNSNLNHETGTSAVMARYTYFFGDPVAQIGDQKFVSLDDAITAAQNGDVITVLDDTTLASNQVIDKTLTLDLGGKTVTAAESFAQGEGQTKNHGYLTVDGGNLTIQNGTFSENGDGRPVIGVVSREENQDTVYSKLTVAQTAKIVDENDDGYGIYLLPANYYQDNDKCYDAEIDIHGEVDAAVFVNGTSSVGDSVINIYGKVGKEVYLNGMATVNVYNGAVINSENSGIEVRAGNLNVYGGTFNAPTGEDDYWAEWWADGNTTGGYAVAISMHATKLPINVNISGGTFNGLYAFGEVDPNELDGNPPEFENTDLDKITLSISGGKFNGEVESAYTKNFLTGGIYSTKPNANCIASGYACISNTDAATKTAYPYKVVPVLTMEGYPYDTTPSTPGYPTIDGTTATVYYSAKTFLNTENKGSEWTNINGTTLSPGNYFMKAVYTKDGVTVAETPQTTFTVTKGTQAVPTAPDVSNNTVTVDEKDRTKSLEYVVLASGQDPNESTNWLNVPTLTNGTFTVGGLNANTPYTVYLRVRENSKYNASPASSRQFTLTQYSVNYNANYGVGSIAAQTANTSTALTVANGSAMSRTGYTFANWNTQADGKGTVYAAGATIDTGATLYAQWTPNSYTVRFDANGGSGTAMVEQSFTYDEPKTLTENAYEKDSYTFIGWATSATGPVVYLDGQNVKNLAASGTLTLYAVWAERTGTVTPTVTSKSGEDITVTIQQGSTTVFTKKYSMTPDGNGGYTAENLTISGIPYGTYNLVVEQDNVVVTKLVVSSEAVALKVTMPDSDVNSVLQITGADTQSVVVGGLNEEAAAKAEDEKHVYVIMTVEKQEQQELPETATAKEQDTQEAISAIVEKVEENKASAPGTEVSVEFMDIVVEKYVKDEATSISELMSETVVPDEQITETNTVIEIVVSYDMTGKNGIIVYRYHDGVADALQLVDPKPADGQAVDGTFYVDKDNNLLYIYANKFSTYAIAYETEPEEEPEPEQPVYHSGSGGVTTYTITGEDTENGKLTVSNKTAAAGKTVTITVKPDDEYKLGTLTVKDAKGNAVTLTKSSDTTYTFKMPSSKVTISATFVKLGAANGYANCPKDANCVLAKFNDVNTREWYHDGIHYCVENGIMNGVTETQFVPNGTLTRGMVVTVLARLNGVAAGTGNAWYIPGQEWAVANGISDGTNMTANITREQLATMLYRYAQLKKVDVDAFTKDTNTLSHNDVFTISDWATSGMHFCIAAGIVGGDDHGNLNPLNNATRAEAAAIFQRFCEKVLAK